MHGESTTEAKLMKPLRVLVVSNHWGKKNNPTFGGVWADRQIVALQKQGVEVDTFDLGTSHSPGHILRKLLELRRAVQARKPDIVHARYGTLVALVTVFSGCKTVVTYAGSDLLRGAGISLLRTCIGIFLSNIASLRADAIVCVSDELRQSLWWRCKRAVVIPDGVDLNVFKPMPKEDARQKIGWPLGKTIVITDAAGDPICKGLTLSQEAIKLASGRIPGIELHVLKGVKPSEMPLYCNAADLLLFASRQEGSPNMVKEAMACNLPVVGTPVGDVPQLLAGVCPSAVVPRTPTALAHGIVEVLQQGTRSNGRSRMQHLALENIAAQVVTVYESTLRGDRIHCVERPDLGFLQRVRLSLSIDYRIGRQMHTSFH